MRSCRCVFVSHATVPLLHLHAAPLLRGLLNAEDAVQCSQFNPCYVQLPVNRDGLYNVLQTMVPEVPATHLQLYTLLATFSPDCTTILVATDRTLFWGHTAGTQERSTVADGCTAELANEPVPQTVQGAHFAPQ